MMFLISIALALLSLTGGMLLLAKTNKDALNVFFRIVSWFIIVSSFLTMVCAGMQCLMKMYTKSFHYEMMMHHMPGKKERKMHMREAGMYHHGMKNKYDYSEEMSCYCKYNCDEAHPRRHWEKRFNDSCVEREPAEKRK